MVLLGFFFIIRSTRFILDTNKFQTYDVTENVLYLPRKTHMEFFEKTY